MSQDGNEANWGDWGDDDVAMSEEATLEETAAPQQGQDAQPTQAHSLDAFEAMREQYLDAETRLRAAEEQRDSLNGEVQYYQQHAQRLEGSLQQKEEELAGLHNAPPQATPAEPSADMQDALRSAKARERALEASLEELREEKNLLTARLHREEVKSSEGGGGGGGGWDEDEDLMSEDVHGSTPQKTPEQKALRQDDAVQAELARLRTELAAAKAELGERTASLEAADLKVQELEAKEGVGAGEEAELQTQLSALSVSLEEKDTALVAALAELAALQETEEETRLKPSVVVELEKTLASVEASCAQAAGERDQLTTDVQQLETNLESAQKHLEEASARCAELTAEGAAQVEQIEGLKQQISAFEADSTVTELNTKVEDLQQQVVLAEQGLATAAEEADVAATQYSALQSELAAGGHVSEERDALRATVAQLEEDIEAAQNALAASEALCEEQTQRVDFEAAIHEERLHAEAEQVRQLQAQATAEQESTASAVERLAEKQAECDELARKLSAQEVKDEAEAEAEAEGEGEGAESEDVKQAHVEAQAALQSEIADLKQALESQQDERTALEAALEEARNTAATAEERCVLLSTQVEEQQALRLEAALEEAHAVQEGEQAAEAVVPEVEGEGEAEAAGWGDDGIEDSMEEPAQPVSDVPEGAAPEEQVAEVQRLEGALAEAQEALAAAEARCDTLTQDTADVQGELAAQVEKLQQLEHDMAAAVDRADTAEARCTALEGEVASGTETVGALTSSLEASQKDVGTLQESAAALEALRGDSTEMAEANRELTAKLTEALEAAARIDSLQSELDDLHLRKEEDAASMLSLQEQVAANGANSSHLEQQVASLTTDIEHCKHSEAALEEAKRIAEEEVTKLEAELERCSARVAEQDAAIESEAERQNTRLSEEQAEASDWEAKLQQAETEVADLQAAVERLKTGGRQMRDERDSVQEKLSAAEAEALETADTLAAKATALEELEAQVVQLKEEVSSAKDTECELRTANQEYADTTRRLAEEKQEAIDKCTEAEETSTRLSAEVDAITAQLAATQSAAPADQTEEVEDLSQQVSDLNKALDTQQQSVVKLKGAGKQMKTQRDEAREELATAKTQVASLERAAGVAAEELSAARQEATALEAKVQEMTLQHEALLAAGAEQKAAFEERAQQQGEDAARLQQEADAAEKSSAQITSLEQMCQTLKDGGKKMKVARDEARAQLATADAAKTALQTELAELSAQLSALQEEHATAQAEHIAADAQLQALSEHNSTAHDEMQALRDEVQNANTTTTTLQHTVEELEAKAASAEAAHTASLEELDATRQQLASAEADTLTMKEGGKKMKVARDEARRQLSSAQEELQAVRTERDELLVRVSAVDAEKASLAETLQADEGVRQQAAASLEDTREELARSREEAAQAQQSVHDLTEQIDALNASVQNASNEAATAHEALSLAQHTAQEREAEVQELNAKFEAQLSSTEETDTLREDLARAHDQIVVLMTSTASDPAEEQQAQQAQVLREQAHVDAQAALQSDLDDATNEIADLKQALESQQDEHTSLEAALEEARNTAATAEERCVLLSTQVEEQQALRLEAALEEAHAVQEGEQAAEAVVPEVEGEGEAEAAGWGDDGIEDSMEEPAQPVSDVPEGAAPEEQVAEVQRLEGALAEAQEALAAAEARCDTLAQDTADVQGELAAQGEKLQQLEHDMAAAVDRADTAEARCTALEGEVANETPTPAPEAGGWGDDGIEDSMEEPQAPPTDTDANEKVRQLQTELEAAQEALTEAHEMREAADAKSSKLKAAGRQFRDERDAARKEIAASSARLQEAEAAAAAAAAEVAQLTSDLEALKSDVRTPAPAATPASDGGGWGDDGMSEDDMASPDEAATLRAERDAALKELRTLRDAPPAAASGWDEWDQPAESTPTRGGGGGGLEKQMLARTLASLGTELEGRDRELAQARAQLSTAEAEHHTLCKTHEDTLKTLSAAQERLAAAASAKQDTDDAVQRAHQHAESLERELDTQQTLAQQVQAGQAARISAMETALADAKKLSEAGDSDTATMMAEVTELSAAVQAARQHSEELVGRLAHCEDELAQQTAVCTEQRDELARLQAALTAREAEVQQAQTTAPQVEGADGWGDDDMSDDAVPKEAGAEHDVVEELTDKVAEYASCNAVLTRKCEGLAASLAETTQRCDATEASCRLGAEETKADQEAAEARAAVLTRLLAERDEAIAGLTSRVAALQTAETGSDTQFEIQSDTSATRQDVAALRAQVADLQMSLEVSEEALRQVAQTHRTPQQNGHGTPGSAVSTTSESQSSSEACVEDETSALMDLHMAEHEISLLKSVFATNTTQLEASFAEHEAEERQRIESLRELSERLSESNSPRTRKTEEWLNEASMTMEDDDSESVLSLASDVHLGFLDKEVDQLNDQLRKTVEHDRELEAEAETLLQAQQAAALSSVGRDVNITGLTFAHHDHEAEHTASVLDSLREANVTLAGEVASLYERIGSLEQTLRQEERSRESAADEHTTALRKLDDVQAALQAVQTEKAEVETVNADLAAKFSQLQRRLESQGSLNEARAVDLEGQVLQLQSDATRREARLKEFQTLRDRYEELEAAHACAQQNLHTEKQAAAAKEDELSSQVCKLQGDVAAAEEERANEASKGANAVSMLAACKSDTEKHKAARLQAEATCDELVQKLSTAKARLSKQEHQVTSLEVTRSENESVAEQRCRYLEENLEKARNECTAQSKRYMDQLKQLNDNHKELQMRSSSVEAKLGELSSVRIQLETDLKLREEEVKLSNDKLDIQQRRCNEILAERDAAREQVSAHAASLDAVGRDLHDAEIKNNTLTSEVQEKRMSIARLAELEAKHTAHHEAVDAQLQSAKQALSTCEADRKEQADEAHRLRLQLVESEGKCTYLNAEQERLQGQLRTRNASIDSLKGEVDTLTGDTTTDVLRKDVANLRKLLADAKEESADRADVIEGHIRVKEQQAARMAELERVNGENAATMSHLRSLLAIEESSRKEATRQDDEITIKQCNHDLSVTRYELAQAQAELASFKSLSEEMKENWSHSERALTDSKHRVLDLDEEVRALQKQLETHADGTASTTAQLSLAQRELETTQAGQSVANAATEVFKSDLSKRLQDANEEAATLRRRLATAEGEHSALLTTNERLREAATKAECEYASAIEQRDSAAAEARERLTRMQDTHIEDAHTMSGLRAELEVNERTRRDMEERLKVAGEDDRVAAAVALAAKRSETLQQRLDLSQEEVQVLKQKSDGLASELREAVESLWRCERQKSECEKVMNRWQADALGHERKAKEASLTAETVVSQNIKLQRELEMVDEQVKDAQRRNKRLTDEMQLRSKREPRQDQGENRSLLLSTIKRLEADLESARNSSHGGAVPAHDLSAQVGFFSEKLLLTADLESTKRRCATLEARVGVMTADLRTADELISDAEERCRAAVRGKEAVCQQLEEVEGRLAAAEAAPAQPQAAQAQTQAAVPVEADANTTAWAELLVTEEDRLNDLITAAHNAASYQLTQCEKLHELEQTLESKIFSVLHSHRPLQSNVHKSTLQSLLDECKASTTVIRTAEEAAKKARERLSADVGEYKESFVSHVQSLRGCKSPWSDPIGRVLIQQHRGRWCGATQQLAESLLQDTQDLDRLMQRLKLWDSTHLDNAGAVQLLKVGNTNTHRHSSASLLKLHELQVTSTRHDPWSTLTGLSVDDSSNAAALTALREENASLRAEILKLGEAMQNGQMESPAIVERSENAPFIEDGALFKFCAVHIHCLESRCRLLRDVRQALTIALVPLDLPQVGGPAVRFRRGIASVRCITSLARMAAEKREKLNSIESSPMSALMALLDDQEPQRGLRVQAAAAEAAPALPINSNTTELLFQGLRDLKNAVVNSRERVAGALVAEEGGQSPSAALFCDTDTDTDVDDEPHMGNGIAAAL